jgi:exopolyphosphatase/pppGpp-phosphohydrolase
MSADRTTTFIVEGHQVVLRGDAMGEAVVALGIETVAAHFRHAPPTGPELERAIDAIEDALMATGLAQGRRGSLATTNALLQSLPGLQGAGLNLDEVEALFQRVALAASGPSTALGSLPADRESAAALLILRETMHHLGFDRVQWSGAD